MISEEQLEHLCAAWFCEAGYEYAYGLDISQDAEVLKREDYQQLAFPNVFLTQTTQRADD